MWRAPTKRWICYLDILGFAQLQADLGSSRPATAATARRRLAKVRDLLELDEQATAWSELEVVADPYHDMRVVACSDSVFVSTANNASGFVTVASFAGAYSRRAMTAAGLLVRGAIAFGNVIQTGSVVMGSAVVEAVRREQALELPVVSLCPSAIAKLKNDGTLQRAPELFQRGGGWRLDLASTILGIHKSWAEPALGDQEATKREWTTDSYLLPLRLAILRASRIARTLDPRVRRKVSYAIRRYNEIVTRGPLRGCAHPIRDIV